MKKIFTLVAVAAMALNVNADDFTWKIDQTWNTQKSHKEEYVNDKGETKTRDVVDEYGHPFAAGEEISSNAAVLSIVPSKAVDCKSDSPAEVTLNGVTYGGDADKNILQGETNGQYFAFTPAFDGTLDVAVKMGNNKKGYVIEIDAATLAAAMELPSMSAQDVITQLGDLCSAVQGMADPTLGVTNPTVTGVGANIAGGASFDGTTNFNDTGANEYEIISMTATAGHIYIVGCDGSKVMFRGASLIGYTAGINGVVADKAETASVKKYVENGKVVIVKAGKKFNVAGAQLK
jgi:hypothetical protein